MSETKHTPGPWGFNPRARVGRDVMNPPFAQRADVFQSTRPRGARHLAYALRYDFEITFQSTRPRGARQDGRP